MDLAAISQSWPPLLVISAFALTLLRLLQTQYEARLKDRETQIHEREERIRQMGADRDAWRELAERLSWATDRSTQLAERSQSRLTREGQP